MPTYEYACDHCGHHFERVQRITEDPIKKCPECGKLKARRMITAGNFILKGGGWESDLYSGASNRPSSSGKEATGGESASTPAATDSSTSAPSEKKSDKKKSPSSE